jgi:hypothetical protein
MAENECLVEELGFADAMKDFRKAADTAERVKWGELAVGVVAAYGGALGSAVTTGTPFGAVPGLGIFYRAIAADLDERTDAENAAEAVEEAFDKLQACREEHKDEDGEDPFGEPGPSVFDGFPIIPFEDPDPGADVSDDEIVIFDEEGFIIIEDEDENVVITDPE